MKKLVFSLAVALATMPQFVNAANKFWDLNGATAGSGANASTATWDAVTANWTTSAGGTVATSTFLNTGVDGGRFSAGTDATAAFTVTVSGTINLTQIGVEEGDPTFNGGTLNFQHAAGGTSLLTGIAGGEADSTITINSQVSGTNGFRMARSTVAGNHILNLNNTANNFTGGLFINSGQRINLGASGVIADSNVVTFSTTAAASTLDLAGFNETVGGLSQASGTASSTALGAGTLTLDVGASQSYVGVISGTGNVVKTGAGTQTLNGANTYTGGTTVSAGTLQIGAGGTTGAISNTGTLTNDANVTFNRTNTQTYSGKISGTGTLTQAGTSTLTLSGAASDYSGNTLINSGKIAVGSANALGTSAGNTQVASGAELLFDGAANSYSIAEPIQIAGIGAGDGGAITVQASSNTTLTGPITLSADATVTTAGSATSAYTNANAFTGTNTNLTMQGGSGAGGGSTVSGEISLGTGSLTKSQGGAVLLSNANGNNYSGGTTINSGKLTVTNTANSGTGSGAVTVAGGSLDVGNGGAGGAVSGNIINNATVNFNRSDTSTYSGLLSGTGVVNKLGGGKLILTGNNSYGGATNVNGGTLQVDGAHSGTGLVTVNAGATLGGNGSLAGPVTLAGGNVGAGGSIGTFNTGALTLNSGNFDFEFSFGGGTVADNAVALGSDVWNVSGLLTIMNAVTLVGTDLGTIAAIPATKFTVLTYTSAATDFRFGNALVDDSTITLDGVALIINYDDTVGGLKAITLATPAAVPELSSILTVGLAGVFAFGAIRLGKRFGFSFKV